MRGTPGLLQLQLLDHRFIPACAGNSPPTRTWCWATTVHPRVCGELHKSDPAERLPDGSSPRVRGTLLWRAAAVPSCRFIPACAGNSAGAPALVIRHARFIPACAGNSLNVTYRDVNDDRFIPACAGNSWRGPRTWPIWPVHPRVCGELPPTSTSSTFSHGSSPRVRGTQTADQVALLADRFIPACAGNSVRSRPRGRRSPGSSPRVRGTRVQPFVEVGPHRFIPACAGNSRSGGRGRGGVPVHPRVCGELVGRETEYHDSLGSSPRVRGTRPACCRIRRCRRFIPACAGNSHQPPPCLNGPAVHPRVCGELRAASRIGTVTVGSSPRVRGTRSAVDFAAFHRAGSSPRVRGTPDRAERRHAAARFIPACAGNSPARRGRPSPASVHPRVCGELKSRLERNSSWCGSSPRVRGTRFAGGERLDVARFIPACAGNSRAIAATGRSRTVHPRVCGELAGA